MPFLSCFYALCSGCGARDITGPWDTPDQAAEKSYFRAYRNPEDTAWVLWCIACDPKRCKLCGGEGVVGFSEGWEVCEECDGNGVLE